VGQVGQALRSIRGLQVTDAQLIHCPQDCILHAYNRHPRQHGSSCSEICSLSRDMLLTAGCMDVYCKVREVAPILAVWERVIMYADLLHSTQRRQVDGGG
jgi:hypothetical protein